MAQNLMLLALEEDDDLLLFATYEVHFMELLAFIPQCKVHQSSQCQEDTEYYCNTCKSDLCLLCKERHVVDLDTIYHDVVIYHTNDTKQQQRSGTDKTPMYITENRNGDVIVSDFWRYAVVVTDCEGRYRFSYRGDTSESRLNPRGICTDALSHILVCDEDTHSVHMIDKDGYFLLRILTQKQGIYKPAGLCYDEKAHLLLVGSHGKTAYMYTDT
ncbi:protein wech-like [Saccostrea cucullata]|uniref:protein wech-like n=1 Tax=Saccostrea cuccullata TaxID=36930 RepID=UPI002ECFB256